MLGRLFKNTAPEEPPIKPPLNSRLFRIIVSQDGGNLRSKQVLFDSAEDQSKLKKGVYHNVSDLNDYMFGCGVPTNEIGSVSKIHILPVLQGGIACVLITRLFSITDGEQEKGDEDEFWNPVPTLPIKEVSVKIIRSGVNISSRFSIGVVVPLEGFRGVLENWGEMVHFLILLERVICRRLVGRLQTSDRTLTPTPERASTNSGAANCAFNTGATTPGASLNSAAPTNSGVNAVKSEILHLTSPKSRHTTSDTIEPPHSINRNHAITPPPSMIATPPSSLSLSIPAIPTKRFDPMKTITPGRRSTPGSPNDEFESPRREIRHADFRQTPHDRDHRSNLFSFDPDSHFRMIPPSTLQISSKLHSRSEIISGTNARSGNSFNVSSSYDPGSSPRSIRDMKSYSQVQLPDLAKNNVHPGLNPYINNNRIHLPPHTLQNDPDLHSRLIKLIKLVHYMNLPRLALIDLATEDASPDSDRMTWVLEVLNWLEFKDGRCQGATGGFLASLFATIIPITKSLTRPYFYEKGNCREFTRVVVMTGNPVVARKLVFLLGGLISTENRITEGPEDGASPEDGTSEDTEEESTKSTDEAVVTKTDQGIPLVPKSHSATQTEKYESVPKPLTAKTISSSFSNVAISKPPISQYSFQFDEVTPVQPREIKLPEYNYAEEYKTKSDSSFRVYSPEDIDDWKDTDVFSRYSDKDYKDSNEKRLLKTRAAFSMTNMKSPNIPVPSKHTHSNSPSSSPNSNSSGSNTGWEIPAKSTATSQMEGLMRGIPIKNTLSKSSSMSYLSSSLNSSLSSTSNYSLSKLGGSFLEKWKNSFGSSGSGSFIPPEDDHRNNGDVLHSLRSPSPGFEYEDIAWSESPDLKEVEFEEDEVLSVQDHNRHVIKMKCNRIMDCLPKWTSSSVTLNVESTPDIDQSTITSDDTDDDDNIQPDIIKQEPLLPNVAFSDEFRPEFTIQSCPINPKLENQVMTAMKNDLLFYQNNFAYDKIVTRTIFISLRVREIKIIEMHIDNDEDYFSQPISGLNPVTPSRSYKTRIKKIYSPGRNLGNKQEIERIERGFDDISRGAPGAVESMLNSVSIPIA